MTRKGMDYASAATYGDVREADAGANTLGAMTPRRCLADHTWGSLTDHTWGCLTDHTWGSLSQAGKAEEASFAMPAEHPSAGGRAGPGLPRRFLREPLLAVMAHLVPSLSFP